MKIKHGIISALVFIGTGLCASHPVRTQRDRWNIEINNQTDHSYFVRISCKNCPAFPGRPTIKPRKSKNISVPADSNPYTLHLGFYKWTIEDMSEDSKFRIIPHGVKMIRLLHVTSPDAEPINLGDRRLMPDKK